MTSRSAPTKVDNLTATGTGRHLFYTVLGLGAFIVFSILIVAGINLRQSRHQAIQSGQQAARNLAHVLEEQNARTVQASDLTLLSVIDTMNAIRPESPTRGAEIHALLREKVAAAQFIRAIWVADEHGDLIHDSDSLPPIKLNNAHREYFQRQRENPQLGLFIAPPDLHYQRVVMTVNSRRVTKPHGEFAGVIAAAVDPTYYQSFYGSIDVGQGGLILLLLDDGTLVARSPADQSMIGRSFAGDESFRQLLAGREQETFRSANLIDQVPRIYSYRRIPNTPLTVVVGLSEAELLAGWRRSVKIYGFAALVFTLSIAGLTFFLARQFGQRELLVQTLRENESEIKASLREKEVMLKEIHHRVKNNLQIVSSLLSLQSTRAGDEQAQEVLADSQSRIKSMALIHESLYQTENLSHIDFGQYARKLAEQVARAHRLQPDGVEIKLDMHEIFLGVDKAVPCGLIINELLSNALKHAFPAGQHEGVIEIAMKSDGESYTLAVRDNGIGMDNELDLERTTTLGLKLVTTLVKQLHGQLDLQQQEVTAFIIKFPMMKPQGD